MAQRLAASAPSTSALPSTSTLYASTVPPAAGGLTARLGALGGLLGQPGGTSAFRAAVPAGTKLFSAAGLKGAGRALGPAAGIYYGGNFAADLMTAPGSTPNDILGGAATGAAIGAGVGSFVPVIGTGLGAAAGGVIGGVAGWLGGGDDGPDPIEAIESAAAQLDLNPSSYKAMFDLLKDGEGGKEAAAQQVSQQMLADHQANVQIAQQLQYERELTSYNRAKDQQFLLALQAQTAEFFGPYANNILTSGVQESETLAQLAPSLPEPYRSTMLAQSAERLGASQRLASAYMNQAALLPSQYMMSMDLERQAQMANDQYQALVIQSQMGGQQAASTDLNALVEQLSAQGG